MRLQRQVGPEGPSHGALNRLCHARWTLFQESKGSTQEKRKMTWSNLDFKISSSYTGKSKWESVLMPFGKRRRETR